MTALMADQTYFVQSLKGAARMSIAQSMFRVNESLFMVLFLLIILALLGVFCSPVKICSIQCLMVVHEESCSWACFLQDLDRLHCFRSLATTSFHDVSVPNAVVHLPPTGADTRNCLVDGHWTS